MKAVLRLLTLPIRAVITVLIWICALLICNRRRSAAADAVLTAARRCQRQPDFWE